MITITIKKGTTTIYQSECTAEQKADYERRAKLDVENLNRWVSEGHEVEVYDPEAVIPEPAEEATTAEEPYTEPEAI